MFVLIPFISSITVHQQPVSAVCLSVILYVHLFVSLSVGLSVCLFVCLSACVPVCPSVCLFVCLSIHLPVCMYLSIHRFDTHCLHLCILMHSFHLLLHISGLGKTQTRWTQKPSCKRRPNILATAGQ